VAAAGVKLPFGLPRPPAAPVQPPSRAALLVLFATTFIAMAPHLLRLPLWLGAVALALMSWRVATLVRGKLPPGVWIRAALSIAMVILVVLQYQTIFGRTAGSALLVSFTALKVLETYTLRDAMFCNVLVAVVVLAAFLFDQSPSTAAYGLACLLLIVVNFSMLVSPGRIAPRRAMRLTSRIVLHCVPIAIIAYVLFPRIEGSLWGIASEPVQAMSGLSDRIAPGSITELNLNDEVAFRVDFEGPPPAHSDLYWRALVLERFDGRVWTSAPPSTREVGINPETATAIGSYQVMLEANDKRWLPVLEIPLSIDAPNRLNALALARAPGSSAERTRYNATWAAARYLQSHQADELNTRVYPGISDDVVELARSFAAPGGNAEAVANRILAHFRNEEFYYTLTPPESSVQPVRDFLFDTRSGYCEHYASAFTTLMRAAGFSARVVLGYQGGERNPSGDYTIVRQSNAHAWSEVWVDGRGWLRIDPTAAVAPERIDLGMEALRRIQSSGGLLGDYDADQVRQMLELDWLSARMKQFALLGDAFTHQWNTWVMAYGPEQQRLLLRRLGVSAPDWTWMVLALTASIAAFMLLTYVLLSGAGSQAEGPRKYYLQFTRKLARAGVAIRPDEGAQDLAERAVLQFPALSGQIRTIAAEYTALVYAPQGRTTLARLRQASRQFRPPRKGGSKNRQHNRAK
jgi:protein-glutamine gamma-glutamyltransferase